jgi:uncharacterized protein involved in exopolysaccharide biosynthesis
MTAFGSAHSGPFGADTLDYDRFVPAPAQLPAEQNPMSSVVRAMRGRWKHVGLGALVLCPVLGTLGYMSGTQLYESQAIVRVYPQEASVLYRTGDDSVLKTFDSYVKAETSYIASPPIMERATRSLATTFPEETGKMTPRDLGGSIDIKRVDSLITLTTKSKSANFAAQKLQAVADAYLALHAETEATSAAVRLAELQAREKQLVKRQVENQATMLEVGGEYGAGSLGKAHSDKVAKIEEIASRKDEVEGTLASMKAKSGTSSADMSNQEILRSTLLDRALADLNFERAKREAELSTLKGRYPDNSMQVQDKMKELAVIDQSMADRREQIKVLGQTGALTDTTKSNAETSLAEIQALLDKVTQQLDAARTEARDLNNRMIQLDSLRTEADNIAKLLEETRQGIEVITVEAGKALPGYSVLMSPPVVADKPASDNSKVRAAAGLGAGAFLALAASLILGMMSGRIHYSDTLKRFSHLAPIKTIVPRGKVEKAHADRLRNALQLHPLRVPPLPDSTRVIAVTRLDAGAPDDLALSLATSFGEARCRTLLIDADAKDGSLTEKLGQHDAKGWREALEGKDYAPLAYGLSGHLDILPVGHKSGMADTEIGIGRVRAALAGLKGEYELVILLCGSMSESVSTELLLSVSDLAVAEVRPKDRKANIASLIAKLDCLPRQGGVLTFSEAKPGDPGL